MKGMALFLLIVCMPAYGNLANDGYLTAGEYEWFVTWSNYQIPLIVDGGGALEISVRSNGRLIVQSTSTPLDYLGGTGVYDIKLYDVAQLLYLDGVTELITMRGNATAELRGGSIYLIKSMQFTAKTNSDPHIDLYCQPGWSWLYTNDKITGITGLWNDGSGFSIEFIDDATYDPAWTNINVIIPRTGHPAPVWFGTLLIRRKQKLRRLRNFRFLWNRILF